MLTVSKDIINVPDSTAICIIWSQRLHRCSKSGTKDMVPTNINIFSALVKSNRRLKFIQAVRITNIVTGANKTHHVLSSIDNISLLDINPITPHTIHTHQFSRCFRKRSPIAFLLIIILRYHIRYYSK